MSAATDTPVRSWAGDIQRIQDQAGGVLDMRIIRSIDAPALICDAVNGDAEASRIATALCDTIARLRAAPRAKPALCGSCPRPLRKNRFAIVLAMPFRDDATDAIGMGICERCGVTPDEIRAKAVRALRRVWPDIRPFEIQNRPAGHA